MRNLLHGAGTAAHSRDLWIVLGVLAAIAAMVCLAGVIANEISYRRALVDERCATERFAEDVLGVELAPWQRTWSTRYPHEADEARLARLLDRRPR